MKWPANTRWGSPKEYAEYHRIVGPPWMQDRFLLWLKNERPDLHALTLKEISRTHGKVSPRPADANPLLGEDRDG